MTKYEAIRILDNIHSRQEHVYEAINMEKNALMYNLRDKGYWIDVLRDYSEAGCSLCGETFSVTDGQNATEEYFEEFKDTYQFCQACGAIMDGEETS